MTMSIASTYRRQEDHFGWTTTAESELKGTPTLSEGFELLRELPDHTRAPALKCIRGTCSHRFCFLDAQLQGAAFSLHHFVARPKCLAAC